MKLRGERARAALRDIVDQLAPSIPSEVDITIFGDGPIVVISVLPNQPKQLKPAPGSRGTTETPVSIAARTSFGSWIPFLPSELAKKVIAADLLEAVRDGIATATDQAWPAPGLKLRSAVEDNSVHAWFEDATGGQRCRVTISGL